MKKDREREKPKLIKKIPDEHWRLPQDTREFVSQYFRAKLSNREELDKIEVTKPTNLALLWNKLLPLPEDRLPKESKNRLKIKSTHLLTTFVDAVEASSETKKILNHMRERTDYLISSMRGWGYNIERLTGKVVWRMVVGLGTTHPLETGMTLHQLYGFPYIPGSSVKGLARSFAFFELANKAGITPLPPEEYRESKKQNPHQKTRLEKFELLLMQDNLGDELNLTLPKEAIARFRQVFGTFDAQGKVVFFDAFPQELPNLEQDIMAVHYQEYYQEGGPPADYQKPILIYFLTLKKGTKFCFYLAGKDNGLLSITKEWLKGAIKEFGVGAKTRVGYGELEVR
ncbi:type III-B CRISPR module RAMP protein Cmr6 [Dehalococcoidales bacterium]|nr:type III-B CRISPR module RAMP protein Cmr6 [Dehalococcoidales bacterium]